MKWKLIASALFLCTAVSVAFTFLRTPNGPWFLAVISSAPAAAGVAAIASPLVFVCACVLVFFRPRFGNSMGLLGGLIALPWFLWTEGWFARFSVPNSWIYLNLMPVYPEEKSFVAFVELKILSMALIVIAIFVSMLRLLMVRRTWPAFAVSFIALGMWFVHSASPYRTPMIARGPRPEFRILYVRRRGIRFHETEMSATRNDAVFVSRTDRRLFQYRFESQVARISLAAVSQFAVEHAGKFAQSSELRELHTPPAKALHSWNADGWYVVLGDSAPLAFTSENQTSPPQRVTDLFREIEKLPAAERPLPIQDVCLGFCYDPVAQLASR